MMAVARSGVAVLAALFVAIVAPALAQRPVPRAPAAVDPLTASIQGRVTTRAHQSGERR
jgi:hypothetical protein